MLAEQDHFAAGGTALGPVRRRRSPGQVAGQLLGLPYFDFAGFDQPFDHGVEQALRHLGGSGHAAGMQAHVVLLNAIRGKRPQGREILGQPHCGHDAGQFGGRRRAEQAMVDARAGIGFQRTAHGAHLHGQRDFAQQIAVRAFAPAGQRPILPVPGRVGMRPGLDGPPVVARGEGDGIHAVHDALVVGGCPVRIDQGQIVGQHDAVPHGFAGIAPASQILHRNAHPGLGDGPVGQIRQDAQEDFAAGDGFNQGGNAFAHAVDQVGAHRIPGIDQQVRHHHPLAAFRGPMNMRFQAPSAAASGQHLGV